MAASSSPTATLYISQKSFSLPTPGNRVFFTNYTSFESKPRRFCIRNSNDASVETTAADADSESSIEAPREPPSLISALNVERALRGIPITDVDHYGRLGVARGSSYDQVAKAYQAKVEELIINQGLDEEELRSKQDLLKESYTILSTPEERRLYDWSLARSQKPERYVWPFEVDKAKPSTEPPPPQEPEDVGPTRFVGYFLLGWLILSIALSIALAR